MLQNLSFTNNQQWSDIYEFIATSKLINTSGSFHDVKILAVILFILTLILLTHMMRKINAGYERLKIFDKGNVPSVPNKSIISGNYFCMIAQRDCLEKFELYHQKLGKTFGFFYGPDSWVVTTDLELLDRIFLKEGTKHINHQNLRVPFTAEITKSLAQVKGEEWKKLRRALNPSFTQKQMKSDNVFESIKGASRRFVDCINAHKVEEYTDSSGNKVEARTIDLAVNFKKYTAEVIFQVAYGQAGIVNMNPGERDPYIEAFQKASEIMNSPIIWVGIFFERIRKVMAYFSDYSAVGTTCRYIHRILDKSLKERRSMKTVISPHDRKMIDSVIESMAKNELSDVIMKANLFFLFVAGFETTANTLAFLFWLLARHPEVQEKLRSGILAEGERCNYLDLCIKETLRLYPAVPTGVGRQLTQDVTYGDMTFFKGTYILASVFSLHRLPEYWGDDAELFRPERFEELKLHPVQFFAFGHGPRRCIGMNLAWAEIRYIVTNLLLRFKLETCPTTPETIKPSAPNIIHMIIDHPIDIRLVSLS